MEQLIGMIEDDIDIEEHDLINDPALRRIFPDISVIKKELQDFEGAATESSSKNTSQKLITTKLAAADSVKPTYTKTIKNVIKTPKNKFFFGSKPSTTVNSIKNKIIFEEQVTAASLSVKLQNCSRFLYRTKRFCTDCYTLYPGKIEFEKHNIEFHTINKNKIEIENTDKHIVQKSEAITNKIIETEAIKKKKYKSLRAISETNLKKNNKNTENEAEISSVKSTDINEKAKYTEKEMKQLMNTESTTENNQCLHCEMTFISKELLIEHIYLILQTKSQKPVTQEQQEITEQTEKIVKKANNKILLGQESKTEGKSTITVDVKKGKRAKSSEKSDSNEMVTSETVTDTSISTDRVADDWLPKKVAKDVSIKPSKNKLQSKNRSEEINNDTYIDSETDNIDNSYVESDSENDSNLNPPKDVKSNKTSKKMKNKEKKFKEVDKIYFRCPICTYYLKNQEFLYMHLFRNHKIKKFTEVKKKVAFNPKCKFCFDTYENTGKFNEHLYHRHMKLVKYNDLDNVSRPNNSNESIDHNKSPSNKVQKNTENLLHSSVVLQSIIFKCFKCDVHFLSSNKAVNHSEHIEMLVNWKCKQCMRIFKKSDENVHKKQHTVTHKFTVFDLDELDSYKVLYKCSKCGIHFVESNYLKHYLICGDEVADSSYCKTCDILLDSNLKKTHKYSHFARHFKRNDFIIIDGELLLSSEEIKELQSIKMNEEKKEEKQYPIKEKGLKRKKNDDSKTQSKKRKVSVESDFSISNDELDEETSTKEIFYFHCDNCSCSLTLHGKSDVHIKQKCTTKMTYICRYCGLRFTNKTINVHRKLHEKSPNITLHNINIYEIKTGQQIVPPIPSFPQCAHCGVRDINKTDLKMHICSDVECVTCDVCNEKFVPVAYELHKEFHVYSIGKAKKQKFAQIIQKTQKKSEQKNDDTLDTDEPNNSDIKLTKLKPVVILHRMNTNIDENLDIKTKQNVIKEIQTLLYFCNSCDVSVDSYNKAIEHCQNHYSSNASKPLFKICVPCDLKIEIPCFKKHLDLHNDGMKPESFVIMNFDMSYFSKENDEWVEHILGSVPEYLRKNIIENSIYRYECRLMMKVEQNGPPDLTVYKCRNCRLCVDPKLQSLYRHCEGSCPRKAFDCLDCGLKFNSTLSRKSHIDLHNSRKSLGTSSYRIVMFNKLEKKVFVLYQCRNCEGIIPKTSIQLHNCDQTQLKKCIMCGLLIYKDDFQNHLNEHNHLANFSPKNIKVILVKTKIHDESGNMELVSSFEGVICDYTFFKCEQCSLCFRLMQNQTHNCQVPRLKCEICNLLFAATIVKTSHLTSHEGDPDFVRENMNLIKYIPAKRIKEKSDKQPSILDNVLQRKSGSNVIKKETILYKCRCNLHFLDTSTLRDHLSECNSTKISKQTCSKCDLLFMPNVLFKHLSLHHGDKTTSYKFKDITMPDKYDWYKCEKCYNYYTI